MGPKTQYLIIKALLLGPKSRHLGSEVLAQEEPGSMYIRTIFWAFRPLSRQVSFFVITHQTVNITLHNVTKHTVEYNTDSG